MKDILEEIMAHKRHEVEAAKQMQPLRTLADILDEQCRQEQLRPTLSLSRALVNSSSGIISEFKRRSPSKGWISPNADPAIIAPAYEQGGATALSVLTDTKYFGGSDEDLRTARAKVSLPILRKDFICDEYQLYEAHLWGADAILLIASALERNTCIALARKAKELQLEVLLELHHERELEYLNDAVDVVGINNRNLGTFHTDTEHSFLLAEQLPREIVRISESGISDAATARELRQKGFQGFLIGELFMRTENPGDSLKHFLEQMHV
jgi:indole-3-glycerol phosphate synthase